MRMRRGDGREPLCLGELSRVRFYRQSRKQPSGRRRPRTLTIIAKGIFFSSIDFTSLHITSKKSSYLVGLSMSYDILLDSPRLVLTCWRKTLKTLAQSVILVLVSLGHLLPWPMRGLNHDFFEHLYRDCSNKLLSVVMPDIVENYTPLFVAKVLHTCTTQISRW